MNKKKYYKDKLKLAVNITTIIIMLINLFNKLR